MQRDQQQNWDVLTFGETMLRLHPDFGSLLEDADTLHLRVAGSESNMAVALARLGVRVAWGSRLPNSGPGRRISGEMRRWQVDVSQVIWEPEHVGRAGLFYVEYGSAPRPTTVLYDRANSSASHLQPGDISTEALAATRLLHLSGITPALGSSCAAFTKDALARAAEIGVFITFDVNYRSRLWGATEARTTLQELMPYINLLICTEEDAGILYGLVGEAGDVVKALCSTTGVTAAVLTCGGSGAFALSGDSACHAPGLSLGHTVDRLGAGDAFAAGVLYGLLHDDMQMGLEYGMAMAALKHTYAGDLLLATHDEIANVAKGGSGGLHR